MRLIYKDSETTPVDPHIVPGAISNKVIDIVNVWNIDKPSTICDKQENKLTMDRTTLHNCIWC